MENTTVAILLGILVGLFFGIFIGVLMINTDGSVAINTNVLDEVCVQLYGNGTESYNPNWFVIEGELKCMKILIVEKELTSDSKIKFIDEECEK